MINQRLNIGKKLKYALYWLEKNMKNNHQKKY